MLRRAAAVLAVITIAGGARAQPAPTGPHPRILLDAALRAQWKQVAKDDRSAVHRAIARCADARRNPRESGHDNYMALDWSATLQACLVAWATTGSDDDAATAMRFFGAMLDDLSDVGDGKGGDQAARRDSGFAIRAMGPVTAIAYDWLHDHRLMTEPLRAKARQRFKAWTDWYAEKGYRAHDPGNNYHAGYLAAATLMAVAEGGEAGTDGDQLWRTVADEMWGKEMANALADGGILDGGDWTEGWQYGPLSVAEYALAARVAAANGIKIDNIGRWLEQLLTRAVHALEPNGHTFAVGDTEFEEPSLPPSMLPLAAVVIGDAPPAAQAQAKGEIQRLGLEAKEFPLYAALVEGRPIVPQQLARETWPTTYLAGNAGVLYARTAWRDDAVWMAFVCNHDVETDHHHPDAGNLVVSRGKDEVIVDPSPYGTMSTFTSNAPTVESAHFPDEYKPSQGFWSTATGYAFAAQTSTGALAMRCDYADQYKFQDRPSDVKRALRDVVMVPWNGGTDASIVVVDRAITGDGDRPMYLRFRTPGHLEIDHGVGRGKVGGSSLILRRLFATGGEMTARHVDAGDCFKAGTVRGRCDAARFAVDEYRTQIPGPAPAAIHVLDVGGRDGPAATATGDAVRVVTLPARGQDPARVVVVADEPGDSLAYKIPKPGPAGSEHLVLDAPGAGDGTVGVTAAAAGGDCAITLSATGGTLRVAAAPASVFVDAACNVKDAAPRRAGAAPKIVPQRPSPPRRGGGCCSGSATPGSSISMTVVVLGLLARRRRRSLHGDQP